MEATHKNIVMDTIEQSSIAAQAGWISLFAALTAVGAQVEIPNSPVPFTLQTFFVLLSGAFLGPRNGFIAQGLYLAAGALGLPVFSGASFGLARILGFTGGYLLSFPVAALLVGYLVRLRRGYLWTLGAMLAALVVIFSVGTLYLFAVSSFSFEQSFGAGFLIFSWWDILKLAGAAAIYTEMSKRFRTLPR